MLNLHYDSIHSAAKEVCAAYRKHYPGTLWLIPYNRHSCEGSNTWWLSPSNAKTAFQHGKLFLSATPRFAPAGRIVSGLHVEKGYEVQHPDKAYIMSRKWCWHRFAEDLDGRFEGAVRNASEIVGKEIEIRIETPSDFIVYSIRGRKLTTMNASLVTPLLQGLRLPNTLSDLKTGLRKAAPSAAWFWFDIFVYTDFGNVCPGPDNSAECSAMLSEFSWWVGEEQPSDG
jgi:hypothetical protein